jgi:hypothetical protein
VALKEHLDNANVLLMLSIADRFNATTLKAGTLAFIMEHPEVTEMEIFDQLAQNLQDEVRGVVAWCRPFMPMPRNPALTSQEAKKQTSSGYDFEESSTNSSKSDRESVDDIDDALHAMRLHDEFDLFDLGECASAKHRPPR